jgi:hypothetical protein
MALIDKNFLFLLFEKELLSSSYAASARRGRMGGGTGGASTSPGGVSASSKASRNVASLRSLSIFSPKTSLT